MKYIDNTRQELLVDSRQFPGEVLVHRGFDRARLHWHEGFEILYVRQCAMHVVIDGNPNTLQDGDVLLVPPRSLHTVVMMKDQNDSRLPEALSITLEPLKLMSLFPTISQAQASMDYSLTTLKLHDVIERHCEAIFMELTSRHASRFLAANAALYSLLAALFHFGGESEDQGNHDFGSEKSHVISSILAYMQDHYDEALKASQVASLFGYSREHFSRIFKQHTTMTFRQYLIEIRLEHACRYLSLDRIDVRQVWRLSGFPNESSFRNEFHHGFQCSPEEYRRTVSKTSADIWE